MITIPMTDPTDYGNKPGDGPLRVGGQPGEIKQGHDLPSTESKCVKAMKPALEMCRDLFAGPEQVRAKGPLYLPKAPGEDADDYRVRLQRSVFFNAFRHTVEGLVGFVFRKDPVLSEDVPAQLKEDWENIDNAGTHGDVFLRELMTDAQVAGHGAILVEYPKTGGTQTLADELLAVRPYWVHIKKDHIVSWRTANENGRPVLTQLVVKECTMEPNGQFGEEERTRYRVFYRDGVVGFRLLEVTKDNQVLLVDEGTYPTQTEIPVAEIKTNGSKSMFESTPPLIDVAFLNVAHYQGDSDYKYSIYKTNVPILFAAGFNMDEEGGEVVIGPNSMIVQNGPDAKLAYVSHDGAALGESRLALQDIKSDMAALGLSMLAPDKRAAETAEAKRIDKSTSDSALAVSARALQDGAERAMGFHAKYRKLPSGGSVTINRDFENLTLTYQQITALSNLVAQNQITLETLWKMLIDGAVLPDDFSEDEEKAQLAAEAEIRRQEAMDIAAQQAQSDEMKLGMKKQDGMMEEAA
jgi:hypothetical protein